MKFETVAVHAGEEPRFAEGSSGDVVVPIHLSSTFARRRVDAPTGGYEYSRTANPTRDALEERLAALEEARFGLAFASGLAAETSIALALLKPHDHVVAFDDLYGGTRRFFDRIFQRRFELRVSYVDARSPEEVRKAIEERTRILWLETPTNPLLRLCDIEKLSEIAHRAGVLVVVDNTFATPFFQRPLALGADIVVHSTTKYLNGHSDSVGGAVMLSDEATYEKLKFVQNSAGIMLSPFDSFLVLRGTKTLAVRMKEHERNALLVARYLESRPEVERVIYPGLPSHEQHALARKQMSGFGGMVSFELAGGAEKARSFLEALRVFALAESLGGVESLIEHPALMTHSSVAESERMKVGITGSLIRASVGIENVEDLTADLEQAFRKSC